MLLQRAGMAAALFCVFSPSRIEALQSPARLRALPPLRAMLLQPQHPRASLLAMADEGSFNLNTPAIPAAEPHDYFNLLATSAMAALVVMSRANPRWNRPLALLMCVYLVLDAVWLVVQPDISGGSAGGGALTLLGHHVLALLIALHAATWGPHTPFTSHMAVVEMNTLILMLERTVTFGGALVTATLHKLFVASWVATRLIWFPFLAVRLSLMGGYPSLARRLVCASCVFLLSVLQFVWTWNFLMPEKQIALL